MATHPDEWTYGDSTPDPHGKDLIGLKAQWILRQLPANPHPQVLDFGSGEGKYLHLIRQARPGARLFGVDARAPKNQPDFEFHQVADGGPLPFADDFFDLIVSCDVLEHVSNAAQSLNEIHRVLRRGGRFIGFVPIEGGPGPHAFFRLFDRHLYRDTKDHRHAFSRTEMRDLMLSRFDRATFAYSYHLLGGLLDAAFFASFKLPAIGPRMEAFWRGQENPFYRRDTQARRPSLIGRLTGLANRISYHESRLLHHLPLSASGLHFCLEKTHASTTG